MKVHRSHEMRGMSMASSSSSHAVDDLDSDFFDQLANDFDSGDLGSLQGDFRQDERDRLDVAFSSLILGDGDGAPITSSATDVSVSTSIEEEIGKNNSIELASWLEDDDTEEKSVVTESSNLAHDVPYPLVESSAEVNEWYEGSHVLDGSLSLHAESNKGSETQDLVTETLPGPFVSNKPQAAEVSRDRVRGNGVEPSGLRDACASEPDLTADLPSCETPKSNLTSTEGNFSKEAFRPMLVQNGSFDVGDKTPFVANDHPQLENSATKLVGTAVDRNSVEDCNAQPLPSDVGGDTASDDVRELQWSNFNISCAHNAFGSYSDFLSELGSESLVGSNQQITAPVSVCNSENSMDLSAASKSQGSFGENFFLQAGTYHHGSPVEHFDERVSWNQLDGLKVGAVEQDTFRSTGFVPSSSDLQHDVGFKQSFISKDVVSGDGGVSDMSITGNYGAQPQEDAQQSWENMYPGWYFDYASNEWKQIEGWSSEQGQYFTREDRDPNVSQLLDSSQSVMMASSSLWQSDQGQSIWLNQESDHDLNAGTYAANDNKQAASSSLPEHQTNGEQLYPGWYFDYQTQQWCQIADNSQHWGSTQDPKLLDASENVDSAQSQQFSGGIWRDQQGQPHLQSETNQSIYAPERRQIFSGSSESHDLTTLGRGMSFKSWAEPGTDGLRNIQQGDNNLQLNGSVSPWTGLEDANRNASYHVHQAETHSINQCQQGPTLSDEQSVFGFSQGFFQPYPTPTGGVGQERSSAGRPSHALVTFGFGGKLVTMKAPHFGNVEPVVVHDLNHLVLHAESQNDLPPYFSALARLGLSGPLHGCSSKDVLRWVDERIENCRKENPQGISPEGFSVLWGVLKIACQHYGKLRSVAGSAGTKLQMEEGPEVALGRLLGTAKSQSLWNQGLATFTDISNSLPAGHQLQAALNEVRNQLMDGKLKEALQIAQQGQLWGLALVLAWQLGEKVYADTVLQMAQNQFLPGSPMRTLLLLFAGQASELFKVQSVSLSGGSHGSFSTNSFNVQDSAGGMLSDWLGNLSIIAANPTKGDEQVITHLGDSLWKDQGEVAGAHTCYLVADTTFEPFSKEARLCLVGADHFKFQRTFATPQAIQRTEVYEYAKSLGNPQYVLVPFQPFKILYAHMLAEAGRISEASRYCQMVIKSLKSAGRGSEIEFCKQSVAALEERLRLHTQGGYGLNFSTGKLVGKVMGTIDSTIHKLMGGPPLPQQATPFYESPLEVYANDRNVGSATKPSPMIPSASNNSLSSANNQVNVPTRSVSEPNLIWSATQELNAQSGAVTSSASPSPSQLKSAEANRGGYLGRFGSQIFAKAMGLVRNSKEAKLGDENKFYYDEKLKRWVEPGAEHSTDEAVLPPPPIVASFNAGSTSSSDMKSTGESYGPSAGVSLSADLPPMPPSVNQFSARGRLHGVRSRYVDTFNKGNGQVPARSSQSPVVPAAGGWAMTGSPSQFFPSPSTAAANGSMDKLAGDQNNDARSGYMQIENEPLLPKNLNSSFMDVPVFQKHLSTGNMAHDPSQVKGDPSSLGSMARAVSWSGEPPNISHQHNLSNGSMADAQTKTSLNASAIGPLPSPPQILEPPVSHTGYGSGQTQTVTVEGMFSGSLHGAAFGEMREVEL